MDTSLLLMGEALLGLAVIAAAYELDEWLRGRKERRIVRRVTENYRLPPKASHLMPWRGKHAANLRRAR